MGDISVIARRLSDKHVQYGWSGNGGYFSNVGLSLLRWYNTPDMVEYLFGLGQLRLLWEPYSEKSASNRFRTTPTGSPHWVDSSEQFIFGRIAFVDYGYFYDADETWYYVVPGPFRIKLPLTLIALNLDGGNNEFSFLEQVQSLVLDEIFNEHHGEWLKNSGLSPEELQKIQKDLKQEDYPLYELWDNYNSIFKCFDDWILIKADDSGKNIGEIILHPNAEQHIETIFW